MADAGQPQHILTYCLCRWSMYELFDSCRMCTKMKTKTNDDGNNEDRNNMLLKVAVGRCGCFTLNLTVFVGTKIRSSKVNSGTALEALGWRLFFFPPGGPGPDDLSLQTAVDDMRTVQKIDCT